MKEEYLERFRKLKDFVRFSGDFRTFPNGKKLSLQESVTLNNIGKLCEFLFLFLDEIERGKLNIKKAKIVRQARMDLEDLGFQK